jgi:hypothetical protein
MAVSRKIEDPLREFYERRHPEYKALLPHWLFLESTYRGGRDWFASNIFKFHKEGATEFNDRLERAYRFNHTREVVDLLQKYLFKGPISRNEGLTISQFMRLVATSNSIFGRVGVIVDNNLPPENAVTISEVEKSAAKIYTYLIKPQDLLDYAFDEEGDGGLLWVKVRERMRDDRDPINSSGDVIEQVRLWTREGWQLFREKEQGSGRSKQVIVELVDEGVHSLGVVPVILVDHTIGTEPYRAAGLIDDIACMDRAVANYLSNLDAIIQDQTFSQLAMPAQALLPGEDSYNKVVELGTKRIFVYDAGAGSSSKPEFISPDPKQAGVILTVINKAINEIYHTIGLAGERTKQDNAVGIDNSSGVAKAYDFERVNSLLLSKAQSCENAENKLVNLVCLWAGEKAPAEKLVTYPETFDVMRLSDDLAVAEQLVKINAPVEIRREQMRIVSDKLFAKLSKELKEKIRKDIDSWMEGQDLVLNPPSGFVGPKPKAPLTRQGQVTKDTPART